MQCGTCAASPVSSTSPFDCQHLKREEKFLGVDPQRGRYADVYLKVCPSCQAHWIHYYFEYEHLTGRGRESLPSYQAGGSYFGGKVHSRSGPLLDNP